MLSLFTAFPLLEQLYTFDDNAEKVFIPNLRMQLETSMRLDIVWDTYIPDSLKESTREKVCTGKYQAKQSYLANGWTFFMTQKTKKNCLKVAEATFPPDSLVYVTSGESVLHTGSSNHICQIAITRKLIRELCCMCCMHYSRE